jgi:dTDP-4-amino-4,6-dideoxygalactose transaminase
MAGPELRYIQEALDGGHLAGDGVFTRRCHKWLEQTTGAGAALLTHSCTGALEMAAILCGLQPGDEVVMPSYTFVSTANAVALRGAVPVFVDIRPDTLNLDERLVEAAVTERTKAIFVVHYAGVSCAMDEITKISERHRLFVVEDAAQGLLTRYRGRAVGSIGHLAAISFHETKNVISGEGGALLINDPNLKARAEVIREKGTNRSSFFRGEVDKYTWVDIGSSYLPSEITAAFLYAQLESATKLTAHRRLMWDAYHEAFAPLEQDGLVRRPIVPLECEHNAHLYYLLLPSLKARIGLSAALRAEGILAPFHYVPLHSAPAGRRMGRVHGPIAVTDYISDRLLRLPLWSTITTREIARVIEAVQRHCTSKKGQPRPQPFPGEHRSLDGAIAGTEQKQAD